MLSDCHWIQYTADKKFIDYFNHLGTKKGINGEQGLWLENDIYQLVLFENKLVWNTLSDRFVKKEERGKWIDKGDMSSLFSHTDLSSVCLTKPCLNGATCRDVDSSFECVCPRGKNQFIKVTCLS